MAVENSADELINAGRRARRSARVPVRRTMTYRGCWTCRSRGIKCDEGKPGCDVCSKSRTVSSCEGYGIKLAWPDDRGRYTDLKGRRNISDSSGCKMPTYSSQDIDRIFLLLDSSPIDQQLKIGLFSVFPLTSHIQLGATDRLSDAGKCHETLEKTETSSPLIKDRGSTHDMLTVKYRLIPLLDPFLSVSSSQERQLLHYWITSLSGLMMPTESQDNPFRMVYIPLALKSHSLGSESSGHTTLLYALYAAAAFNISIRVCNGLDFFNTALKYHTKSVRSLHVCLLKEEEEEESEAVSAAIMMMIFISSMNADCQWHLHTNGARMWLNNRAMEIRNNRRQLSIQHQIFAAVELFSTLASPSDLRWDSCIIDNLPGINKYPSGYTIIEHLSNSPLVDYRLDRIFGISRPVLKNLDKINTCLSRGYSVEEIDSLELDIIQSDPDILLSRVNITESKELKWYHHERLFYIACFIHFRRNLRQAPSTDVQDLVLQGLVHMEAIDVFNKPAPHVIGLALWPSFIIACEADTNDLRLPMIKWFERGNSIGCKNVSMVADIVRELWRRRDSGAQLDVDWRDVMREMGSNFLLL